MNEIRMFLVCLHSNCSRDGKFLSPLKQGKTNLPIPTDTVRSPVSSVNSTTEGSTSTLEVRQLLQSTNIYSLACFCNIICQKLISVYISLPPRSTLLYSNQLFLIDSLFPLIMYLDQKGSFNLKPSGYDYWNLSDSFEALISVGLTTLHHKTTKDCTQDPTKAMPQSSWFTLLY